MGLSCISNNEKRKKASGGIMHKIASVLHLTTTYEHIKNLINGIFSSPTYIDESFVGASKVHYVRPMETQGCQVLVKLKLQVR